MAPLGHTSKLCHQPARYVDRFTRRDESPGSTEIVNRLLAFYSAHSAVCGIGTWLEYVAAELAQRDWEVTVALSWGARFHQPDLIELARPSLRTIRMDAQTGTWAARWLAIKRAIDTVRPDIVLVTLLDDPLRVMQYRKQQRDPLRWCFANHGNAPGHLAAAIELSDQLDLTVSVNRSSFQLMRDWPGACWQPGTLCCIGNAIAGPTTPWEKASHGCVRLGFVGRLGKDKGAEQLAPLVDALVERSCNFELIVAGDGPLRESVVQLAERYPGRVRYLGAVSRAHLYQEVYPLLDIILCLSPSEGWPMSLAEAMQHGAVPVTSEYTGIHDENLIRENETGLIFPVGAVRRAADAVIGLAQDRIALARLQAAARAAIESRHSLAKFGDQWNQTLRECLDREPRFGKASERVSHPGRFSSAKEWIRRRLKLSIAHESVRSEWPMIEPRDARLFEAVKQRLSAPVVVTTG